MDESDKEFINENVNENIKEPAVEGLPESPASANIRFWIEDYSVQLTMRDMEVNPLVEKITKMINIAKERGWKPTWDKGTPVTVPVAPVTPQSQSLVCPVHGTVMVLKPAGVSKSTNKPYPPFWSCPSKNADGTYCKSRPSV